MNKESESGLLNTLKTLDEYIKKLEETRGYSVESGNVRILQEMIKEQVPNENTRCATRTTR